MRIGSLLVRLGTPLLIVTLAACPPPAQTPGSVGGGGGGTAAINPDACGTINTSNVGRKLYSFLHASAELDRASVELETTLLDACKRMAVELGTSPEGTTREVCNRAAVELDANLKISVKSEKRLVTRYAPPVCHTDLDFTAGVVAECEASASADVNVKCHGTCSGSCSGACDGTCATGDNATCKGQCNGECKGRCSGRCDGYAEVDASAECKASAEIRASVKTECSEPKVEVVQQDVTIVDDSKFKKAVAAINVGLPRILLVGKRLELAGKALGHWAGTGISLVASTGDLISELGTKAGCVAGQIAGVVAASTQIQARFEVSLEVSAQVSASAGASGQ